jgi:Uma2 family endonuclease
MIATSPNVRFTVDEYFRMSDAGVFDGRRVELIEGRIVRVHAQAHPHRWSVSKANWAFRRRFPAKQFWILVQSTLPLGRFGAPDPDIHAFAVPEGTAEEQLPKPFIVLEVSDKTYRKDTGSKLRMYASAGIRDYWGVNLNERRIEVYRKPVNKTGKRRDWKYAEVEQFKLGQKIRLLEYPKISIAVNEIIP